MAGERIDVTVALLGSPEGYYDITPPEEFERSYSERQRVQLQVSPDESLSNVLQRAASELGVRWPQAFVAFHNPESGGVTGMSSTVTLVDAQGRATWAHPLHEVTFRGLIASAEAGVLAGDPRRPYLVMQPGVGDGTVPDWDTIKAIWDALDFVLGAIGAAATLNEVKKKLAARLRQKAKAASEVVEQRSGDWQSRSGDPVALHQWLDDRVWSSADLAAALGCTEDEAEAVLWSFGFTHSPSCVWRLAQDHESKFFREVYGLSYGISGASSEDVRKVLDGYSRHFIESGEAPRLSWEDLPWLHPSPVVRTVARGVSGFARLRARLRRSRR